MAKRRPFDAASSRVDEDGIRELRRTPSGGAQRRILFAGVALLLLGGATGWWLYETPRAWPTRVAASGDALPVSEAARATTVVRNDAPTVAVSAPPPRQVRAESVAAIESEAMTVSDPNDIAAYFRPGDEEPTAGELIAALRDAGVREGIAAFNPPGTSPPLEGLAVPDDFELPLGYVRHHQVTDEGEPIEPILMFSPDFEFLDAEGRLVDLPADRVVPEELAPPGLPIRRVRIPSP